MKPESHRDEPLDALLASQPLRPSPDFTERVLARLGQEDSLDAIVDAHLAAHPVAPAPDFAARTLRAIEQENDHKVLGFPSWVLTLGTIAALLVAGVLSFAALFNKGWNDARERATAARAQTVQSIEIAALPVSPSAATGEPAVRVAEVSPSQALADISEWEQLLIMQEALADLSAFNEQQDWQTLAMLAN